MEGMCAEELVLSEPFFLRPGGKEHLTQDPLSRRDLPTSLSGITLFEVTDWLLQRHLITFLEAAAGGSISVGVHSTLGYTLNLASLQERERR